MPGSHETGDLSRLRVRSFPSAARAHTAGFTLMEIALVLAIIVVIGAIAAPMFHGTLENERLRKAAELVAADWTNTRALAMELGETQVWMCQTADGSYSSSSYVQTAGLTAGDASNMVAAATGLSPTTGGSTSSFGNKLPEDVTISDVLVSEADTVATMTEASMGSESGTAMVFFYADGTSSTVRLTVANSSGRSIAVQMNGIAGTVRVARAEGSPQ